VDKGTAEIVVSFAASSKSLTLGHYPSAVINDWFAYMALIRFMIIDKCGWLIIPRGSTVRTRKWCAHVVGGEPLKMSSSSE